MRMGTMKMYFFSVFLNFIPLLSLFLYTNADLLDVFEFSDGTFLLYFYFRFFVISLFLNISFFLLKVKYFRNKKMGHFVVYYSSSIFFFMILIYSFYTFDILMTILFCPYFFINFLFVRFFKVLQITSKQKNK